MGQQMGLDLRALRAANELRQGDSYSAGREPHDAWTLNDWFTALQGECGEAANIAKKIRRGDFTLERARGDLADELADVLIYLDILANCAGIDLAAAVMDKFNKTSRKVGSSVYMAADDFGQIGYFVERPSAAAAAAREA